MRITNMMTTNAFLSNLYANNAASNKYSMQLSSEKKNLRLSDNTLDVVRGLKIRKDKARTERYNDNVENAQAMLTQAEASLSSLNDIYQRLHELSISAATGLYGSDERSAVASEVSQLRDEVISIGNSTYQGKYIFGGYNTTKAPFQTDSNGNVLYNGVDLVNGADSDISAERTQHTSYIVNEGSEIKAGINGVELMSTGSDNLIGTLNNYLSALNDENSTTEDLAAFTSKFKTQRQEILSNITEIGGSQSRLELMANRYQDNITNLETARSSIEDIDEAEVIMKMKFAQSVYENTLEVGARILTPTLLDYLR